MDPESILWRSPLVYKETELSPNCALEANTSQGWLTPTHLHIQANGYSIQSIALQDVVGAEVFSPQCWQLHTYPLRNGNYHYQPLTFVCREFRDCEQWVRAIRSALGQDQSRSLTILLNPSSGRGNSRQVWQAIEPIFVQAGCQVQVYETQSAQDLRQQVQGLALEDCSGLIILGGDGSIYHGVNGLMHHPNRDQALRLPLGFIPTGTSNGLVKSILDAHDVDYSAENMAVAIAKGNLGSLDLIRVQQPHQTYFSILSLSWGFFSDVDLESDRVKVLGFLKNYLYTLLRLLTYRAYSGRVELKTQAGWQTLDLDLVTLWTMNVPWAAYNFKPAPKAQLHDAAFDVWITPKTISRWAFLKILLRAFDGQHLGMDGVDYYKVQALNVIPSVRQGMFAIDGEPVPYQPISLDIFPSPLSIFIPEPLTRMSSLES